jgi:hypothetical protein
VQNSTLFFQGSAIVSFGIIPLLIRVISTAHKTGIVRFFPQGHSEGGSTKVKRTHSNVCTAYFRGFVASEAILKFSRWQIFWQGFLKQLLKLPKEPTVAVLMIWYAAPIAIKNSNGYSPFTLYDLSAENQDFPAIRRPTPPQMSMFDPVCVSYETKPLLSCKTPMSQFLYYRPAYGGRKSTSV